MENVHLEINILKKLEYDSKNGSLREQNSINKLAYNHASKLEFNNQTFNWVKKQEDDYIEDYFLKPDHTNYSTSEELFRDLESIENNRMRAQLCFNLLISLDHKLDYETNKRVLNEFLNEVFISEKIPCDISVHNKNNSNLHVHILAPLRHIDTETGKLKNKVKSYKNPHFDSKNLRKIWAEKINKARAEQGITEKIDYRSNAEKMEKALDAGDLVTAQKLDYQQTRKPKFRNKAYRKQRIEQAKQRKAQAQKKSEELQQKINRDKEIAQQINEIEQNKKAILATAEEIVFDYNQAILQRGLNQHQLIEQQRQQQLKNHFKF